MKFTLALFTALISIVQVSALPTAEQDVEARAANTCGDPWAAVPFLRAYHPTVVDHFYTTDANEMQNAVSALGYQAEGTTGRIFSNQQPGTVPLFRLYSAGGTDHFYTTNAQERNNAVANLGYTSEGTAGYVYTNGNCGGLPLYRSYNGNGIDHFYTMSASESDNAVEGGWAKEGIAGYIFPAQ